MENKIEARGTKILVFREPKHEETRGGIILPENKTCAGRVTVALSMGKDIDPDVKVGSRLFTFAYDSFAEFRTSKEYSFEVTETEGLDQIRFPAGISMADNKIIVKAGVELCFLAQDMVKVKVTGYISDQNEVY